MAVLLAVCGSWILVAGWPPAFPLDDAYITLHNAIALNSGADPSYRVSPLEGATSAVHLALVAVAARVFEPILAMAVVAWIAIGLYMAGLLAIARRAALGGWATVAVLVVGTAAGMSAYHLLNGLETGLAMAAVVWSMALAAGPPGRLLPLLAGCLPFVRPELGIISLLLMGRQSMLRVRTGDRRGLALDVALAVLAALPWALWLCFETGHVLPQTGGAKVAFFAEAGAPLASKAAAVLAALGAFALQVGPLVLGAAGLRKWPGGTVGLAFAALLLLAYGAVMPGGLFHNASRYLYLFVPLLALGMVGLCDRAAEPRARRIGRTLLFISALFAVVSLPWHAERYLRDVAATRIHSAALAAWVAREVPLMDRIAVHDAGYLAYATGRPLVDVVGLKTPAARPLHRDVTAPSAGAGRGRAIAALLRETDARYLVVLDDWEAIFAISRGVRAAGIGLDQAARIGPFAVYRVTASKPERSAP